MAGSVERTKPPYPRTVSEWSRPSELDYRVHDDARAAVACPACGKPAGEICVGPTGHHYRLNVCHPARLKAFRDGGAQ